MVRHSCMATLLLLVACSRAQNPGSSSANLTPPRATGFLQSFEELCERETRQTTGSKMSPAQRLALGDEVRRRTQDLVGKLTEPGREFLRREARGGDDIRAACALRILAGVGDGVEASKDVRREAIRQGRLWANRDPGIRAQDILIAASTRIYKPRGRSFDLGKVVQKIRRRVGTRSD